MAKEAKYRIDKIVEIECARCKVWTKHTVQGAYDTHWEDEESRVYGGSENDLLSCNGCNSVTYRENSWFSEEEGPRTTLLPPRGGPVLREPKDFESLSYGSRLESVYRQTITAYNNQLPTLTGAGVRLVIEGICLQQKITDGNVTDAAGVTKKSDKLDGRINGMKEKGLITESQAKTLHEIRFLGNDVVHQLDHPSNDVLEAALNIVDHILAQVYDLPTQRKALQKRKRPRKLPKRKKKK